MCHDVISGRGGNPEVMACHSRNHQKLFGKPTVFLSILQAAWHHFQVSPGSDIIRHAMLAVLKNGGWEASCHSWRHSNPALGWIPEMCFADGVAFPHYKELSPTKSFNLFHHKKLVALGEAAIASRIGQWGNSGAQIWRLASSPTSLLSSEVCAWDPPPKKKRQTDDWLTLELFLLQLSSLPQKTDD